MSRPLPRSACARLGALLAVLALAVALAPAGASADDQGAYWQYAPAAAPPPPDGAAPSPFTAALGSVGDISFWAPNRGLLITGGSKLVSPGLYAYDGVSWHQLSTVCGSGEGRIAWAGPDDFWTISDQRPGQIVPGGTNGDQLHAISLCHFVGDQVVASYAKPLGQADSYRVMDAAACTGPSNCWFGGTLTSPPGGGTAAFHLHWDGSSLTEVDDAAAPHAIAGMTVDGGQLYESDTIASTDGYGGGEDPSAPTVLQTIDPTDPAGPFQPTVLFDPNCVGFCPTLPDYGTAPSGSQIPPSDFQGLSISSDAPTSGDPAADPQLWALDAPNPGSTHGAKPIALRYHDGGWSQIAPNHAQLPTDNRPQQIVADPGEDAAWITYTSDSGAAVALLSSADGGQTWDVAEQDSLGPEQGVGSVGAAGPIACPAAHDCWLATTSGQLFHLSDGSQLPQDGDPVFNGQGGIVTFRPSDAGVPAVASDVAPDDTSLLNQLPPIVVPTPTKSKKQPKQPKQKPLIIHLRSHLHHYTLQLTFTLTARAHVQVLAKRHRAVVARTRNQVLNKGTRHLSLRLNPKRWPTGLSFKAAAVTTKPKK